MPGTTAVYGFLNDVEEQDQLPPESWNLLADTSEEIFVQLAELLGDGPFRATDFIVSAVAGELQLTVSAGYAFIGDSGGLRLVRGETPITLTEDDGIAASETGYVVLKRDGTFEVIDDPDDKPAHSHIIGSAVFDATEATSVDTRPLERQNIFPLGDRALSLTSGATINTDASLASLFEFTLEEDSTLAVPSNPSNGQRAMWIATQDGTGGWDLALAGGAGGFEVIGDVPFAAGTDPGAVTYIFTIYRASINKWQVIYWWPFGFITGPAGGDLSGNYPNPEIAAGAVGTPELAALAVTDAKIAAGTISDGKLVEDYIRANGGQNFTADQSLDGHKITNSAAPTGALDLANKQYVDALANGFDMKGSVRAASTVNLVLSGAQTIDGVAVIAGERVLAKNQTAPAENGPYVVAAGAWSRTTDADASAEVTSGLLVLVEEGTVNGATAQVLTTPNPIVLNTTALTFTRLPSAADIVDGAGITKTGNQLDVNVDGVTLEISSDALRVKDAGISDAKLASTFLKPANNLSDVSTPATARGNLSAAVLGSNPDITALVGLTGVIQAASGSALKFSYSFTACTAISGTYVLSAAEYRNAILRFTNNAAADFTVEFPTVAGAFWFIDNRQTLRSITCRTSGQTAATAVIPPNAGSIILYCDGTSLVPAVSVPFVRNVAITEGGTGSTSASGARTALAAAILGGNADITSLTGLTGLIKAVAGSMITHGRLSKSVAGSSDVTLSSSEYNNGIVELTGVLTGPINVIPPTTDGAQLIVLNNTTGVFTLGIKTSGGTAVLIPKGRRVELYCDGTNWVPVGLVRRLLTKTLVGAVTPAGTGGDINELVIPYDENGTSRAWQLTRIDMRVNVAGGAPAVTIEKSTGTGAFSATSIGTQSIGSGASESSGAGSSLGTVASGDKVRFNVTTLGTATGWAVELTLVEVQ